MAADLEIYVEASCTLCARAVDLAGHMREEFPDARIELIDLTDGGGVHRRLVVATPTYVLNGRVFSLGNPAPSELRAELARLLAEVGP